MQIEFLHHTFNMNPASHTWVKNDEVMVVLSEIRNVYCTWIILSLVLLRSLRAPKIHFICDLYVRDTMLNV